jgi:hypothetical protein
VSGEVSSGWATKFFRTVQCHFAPASAAGTAAAELAPVQRIEFISDLFFASCR